MSLFDYEAGRAIEAEGYPFYAIVQAAMRQADTDNLMRLQAAFPEVHAELLARYNAPGGVLEGEGTDARKRRSNYVAPEPAHKARFERGHFPHDYGSNGRCRIEGCNVYDPTEDDNRIGDD